LEEIPYHQTSENLTLLTRVDHKIHCLCTGRSKCAIRIRRCTFIQQINSSPVVLGFIVPQ